MRVTSSLETALTPTAVALGNFDGVHRGHQRVVQPVLNVLANQKPLLLPPDVYSWGGNIEPELLPSKGEGLALRSGVGKGNAYATVVTFNPHPREFFTGMRRTLLTPLEEKVVQLRSLGVEQLVLLPFTRELACLSPNEFVEKILVQQLRCTLISVGDDFRFGKGRAGSSADLQAIAASYGVEVLIIPPLLCEDERISSSSIRQHLLHGDIQKANRLLGRPYSLTGMVVKGQQLGTKLGFPTANLQLPKEKFLPRQGVYCVRAFIEDSLEKNDCQSEDSFVNAEIDPAINISPLEVKSPRLCPISGVMNIGYRPTVDGTTSTVEVHLLDWSGDLYGKTITVTLEEFLRPEQKFSSLDALIAQIQADCTAARAFLQNLRQV